MKKTILFVSQQFPYPLTDGGNIRTFKLLEGLAAQYDVCLIASVRSDSDVQEGFQLLKGFCSEVVCVPDVKSRSPLSSIFTVGRALLRNLPLAVAHNFNRHIQREVNVHRARKEFWAIHMNHLDTVQYFSREGTEKTVLDSHNLLHLFYAKAASIERSLWKRTLLRLEAWRMRRYEFRVFEALDNVVVCSELEKHHLAGISGTDRVRVVPNGVDCTYFHPPQKGYERNPATVVFTGAMGYSPNSDAAVYFIREVMPILRKKSQGIRFAVVGRDPPAELVALGRQWTDVLVTGKVPDVREHVWGARIFVVPIRKGAGTRLKVLEAFAMGIPTVSTSVGAEGIEFTPEQDLLLADDPASMADRIVELLQNPGRCEALGKRAMALARSRYDWKAVTEGLLEGYERLAAPRPNEARVRA
mgnify:CR=1 FL=1